MYQAFLLMEKPLNKLGEQPVELWKRPWVVFRMTLMTEHQTNTYDFQIV